MALLIILVPVLILALLASAALRWGVDSRDSSTDDRAARLPVGLETR
jgi:nitrogen fixation-related uncharacterized protein